MRLSIREKRSRVSDREVTLQLPAASPTYNSRYIRLPLNPSAAGNAAAIRPSGIAWFYSAADDNHDQQLLPSSLHRAAGHH